MRRPTGSGTIERYGDRHRARLPDAKRTPLGVYDTPELAAEALDAYFALSRAPHGDALKNFAEPNWLERRRRARPKSYEQDRKRWSAYIERWECYAWPMREVRRGDVRRLVDGMQARGLADQTCRNTLNLLRVCFRDAVDDELVPSNPCDGVRIHPRGTTGDTWGFLTLAEQRALLSAPELPAHLQALIAFAIGTGLRWGEQRKLELVDVHLDGDSPYVHVRRGAHGSPKNTKHRRVPLFGLGLAGARALVELGAARRNPRGLLCLPNRGEAYIGANGPRLDRWLELAGIERHLRWHDLRHTCASSLVNGWWGAELLSDNPGSKWDLREARDFMGHSSVTVTERYTHGSVVEAAARRHDGATSDLRNLLSHLGNSNPGPTVYETPAERRPKLRLAATNGVAVAPVADELREAVAVALSDRTPRGETKVVELLAAVARRL